MYKTVVYTLVNNNIQKLVHQKVTLPASQSVNVLLNNITFRDLFGVFDVLNLECCH